jgi:hypothetical protein
MNQGEQHVKPAATRAQAFTRKETYAATRRPVSLAETLLPEVWPRTSWSTTTCPGCIPGS